MHFCFTFYRLCLHNFRGCPWPAGCTSDEVVEFMSPFRPLAAPTLLIHPAANYPNLAERWVPAVPASLSPVRQVPGGEILAAWRLCSAAAGKPLPAAAGGGSGGLKPDAKKEEEPQAAAAAMGSGTSAGSGRRASSMAAAAMLAAGAAAASLLL